KLDLRLLFLIVAAGLALSDAHHPPAHQAAALLRRSPKEPDIKTNKEEPWAETEEQSEQRTGLLLDRLGADFHAVLDQERFQALVHKGGQDGREVSGHGRRSLGSRSIPISPCLPTFRRHCALVVRRRVGHRGNEAAG